MYLYFQSFLHHENDWVWGCKAPLLTSDCFCITSWLCSALQRQSFSQLSSVLSHFNHLPVSQSHQYLFSASVPQSSNSPCMLAALLFPSYSPVGYEGACLREYILFLDSHLQCALRAPSSTVCQWNRALGSGTHCPLWDRRRIQDLYPRAGQAEVQGVCNWAESLWKRGKPSMNLLMEIPAGG